MPLCQFLKWSQSTSIKVQVSISHTPEGTNTVRVVLEVVARFPNAEVHEASEGSIVLGTTPVVSGGELIRNITISKL